ncbi:hypothetical protein N9L02_02990 [Gammaproteobacteria bacterium]|nr:hypothetical protein [Gammaproteobacteria bacterium]
MSYRILIIGALSICLSSCAIFHTSKKSDHDSICKELKRQIIWSGAPASPRMWSGATGDPLQATRQRAGDATLMRSYHEQGCED